jgi:heat shock protein HslJ
LALATTVLLGAAAAQGDPSGAWRLVAILGMDDSVRRAEPPSRYTLVLDGDVVHGRADCNRFRGTAAHDGAGLAFEGLASTRAACAPGSLADAYLRELEHVASFVVEGGALYLATRADGAILAFVPALPIRSYAGTCDDGRDVTLVAGRDWAGLLRDGRFAMLPRVAAASGVRWADDRIEAWNRGDELTVRDLDGQDHRTTCALTRIED